MRKLPVTRSDIGVILIIYATCALFLYMTLQLRASAQIYPLCLIAGLAILDTLYLIRCLIRLNRETPANRHIINDLPEVFKGFQARQFIFVLFACIAYLALLHYIGFYLSGLIFLIGVLLYLKVKWLPITLTTLFLGILVYGVFTLFLKVPLPTGVLFN